MKLPASRTLSYLQMFPWAIQPDYLETIAGIADRTRPPDIEAVLAKQGQRLDRTQDVTIRGDVAVIEITGPVFRYANLFSEISGATSIETLATDLRAALDNPRVSRIVLAIDSPGGQTNGVQEFADMVHAAKKPITAYVNELGASAAYMIAAAADEIVLAPMAAVGSIGVVATVRTDKAKDTIEIVSSQSPSKRLDVATDEGRAQIQSHVDALAAVFVERVAQYRGVDVDTVLSDFGRGGVLIGQAAVDAGMADRLGSLESVIAGGSRSTNQEAIVPDRESNRESTDPRSRYESEWRRDPALRAEFNDDFDAYAAYRAAVQRGAVRFLGKRSTP